MTNHKDMLDEIVVQCKAAGIPAIALRVGLRACRAQSKRLSEQVSETKRQIEDLECELDSLIEMHTLMSQGEEYE